MGLQKIRDWHDEIGTPHFLAALTGTGAAAGLLSCLLLLVAHFLFGATRPTLPVLVLAILRGALFGLILGLILARFWREPRRP